METITTSRIQITINLENPPDFTVRVRKKGESVGRYFRSEIGCEDDKVSFLKEVLDKLSKVYCKKPSTTFCAEAFKLVTDDECGS